MDLKKILVNVGRMDKEDSELIKILTNGLDMHARNMRRYAMNTEEYNKSKRMFIALFEYMDRHNDYISEEHRRLYSTYI